MSFVHPTPIVLCACQPRVGKFVAEKLMPEFEVIHFISNIEQAKTDIAAIMAGDEPPRDPDNVSSHNFSRLPRHVVFGRGFQAQLQEVRESSGSAEWGLCWYRAAVPPGNLPSEMPDMCEIADETIDFNTNIVAGNMKRVLSNVISEGKEGIDGVYAL
ncbi:hypothetical protein LTR37_008373 [Vermiconidia calcicola]|uniref:Uncharacterized protein n=1 Tax=Vermiconidia calcicola TaxID=1690605 RepID=A0ACC3NCG4_9PEZI|nr:hypothetical protein LTR37_008373 [Vermiconidia calcicola]